MAHAATLNGVERYENQLTPGWGKLMMWVFLCSDAMSFAGLLAAYGAVRLGSSDWPVPATHLGVPATSEPRCSGAPPSSASRRTSGRT